MKKMQLKRGKNMTKIQAHRGACSERPENTMAAFRRAIELHAAGIETVEKAVAAHIAGELPRFSPNHSCGGGHH